MNYINTFTDSHTPRMVVSPQSPVGGEEDGYRRDGSLLSTKDSDEKIPRV